MAWVKNPLPLIPLNNDVIGTNDIEITSGSVWTVWHHSLCGRFLFPPLRLLMNLMCCKLNANLTKSNIRNSGHMEEKGESTKLK
jgi:hypothetical protein